MRRTLLGTVGMALTLTVTGCGNETVTDTGGGGIEVVEVTGEIGKQPTVDFSDRVSIDKSATEVLIEGDGAEVVDGDRIRAHLSVANGVSEELVYSSYDKDGPAQVVDVKESALSKGLYDSLLGQTIGSRVVTVSPPKDAFGDQGNPTIGIGNKDTVVFIVDILGTVATEPSGEEVKPAAWAPEVVLTEEVPTGFDFKTTPKPAKKLQVTYLIKGDGDPVKAGDNVTVNYLGQVYKGKEPFDASFTRGEPFDVANVGKAQVIKGWNQALVGAPVGSRMIISVPPELGYGKKGNPDAGIKGTDTMFFLIDVLYVT